MIHPQLLADCHRLGRFEICQVLLHRNAALPWFILVPQRSGITEVFELPEADQIQLWRESARLSRNLMQSFHADKINIGALGNLVPQLHIHVIARTTDDAAWPGPVWGVGSPNAYSQQALATRLKELRGILADS